jgi:hypothetical protein
LTISKNNFTSRQKIYIPSFGENVEAGSKEPGLAKLSQVEGTVKLEKR